MIIGPLKVLVEIVKRSLQNSSQVPLQRAPADRDLLLAKAEQNR